MSFTFEDLLRDRRFTPRFWAEYSGLSEDTIRRWFSGRPGVLNVGEPNGSRRRTRCEIRIPATLFFEEFERRTRGEV